MFVQNRSLITTELLRAQNPRPYQAPRRSTTLRRHNNAYPFGGLAAPGEAQRLPDGFSEGSANTGELVKLNNQGKLKNRNTEFHATCSLYIEKAANH
jgi:hypothetical protein